MSMSKKDFVALAKALRSARLGIAATDSRVEAQWRECVQSVADVCADHNRDFDRSRFSAACGIG